MTNYAKTHVNDDARTELHDTLNLTGAEVSINNLPAGASVPFVHSHKNNEEIYVILDGSGHVTLDGEDVQIEKGDWLRISPSTKRQFFASDNSGISFACVQVKENSLGAYTADDAVMN